MIHSSNRDVYGRDEVVEKYGQAHGIDEAERRMYRNTAGLEVLDLGVGGGRTSGYLSLGSKRYVGADYSPSMVEAARSRYPELDFIVADARNLPFEGGAFDLVVFSFNGIDYCGLSGRKRVLSEVHRVLKPGGRFVFSSHNLGKPPHRNWSHPWRRLWMSFQEVRLADRALLNDAAHGHALLTTYIDPSAQVEDLKAAGFDCIEVLTQWGHPAWTGERRSTWCHYSARRSA